MAGSLASQIEGSSTIAPHRPVLRRSADLEAWIMEDFSSQRIKGWTNALLISMGLWTAIVAGITML